MKSRTLLGRGAKVRKRSRTPAWFASSSSSSLAEQSSAPCPLVVRRFLHLRTSATVKPLITFSSQIPLILFFTLGFFLILLVPVQAAEEKEAPLTFSQALEQGLATNEALKLAKNNIALAEVTYKKAYTLITPRATIAESYLTQNEKKIPSGGTTLTAQPGEQWITSGTVSWALFYPQFFPQLTQAAAQVDKLRATHERERQNLILQIAQAYTAVLKADADIKGAEAKEQAARAGLRDALAKQQVGELIEVDVLEAELAAVNAKQSRLKAKSDVLTARDTLAKLIDAPVDTLSPLYIKEAPLSLPEALERARTHRPEWKELTAEQKTADAKKQIAVNEFFPTFSLDASYNRLNPPSSFSDATNWQVRGTISLPFFRGGLEWLDLHEGSLAIQGAKISEESLVKQIEQEVIQNHERYQLAKEQTEVSIVAKNLAEKKAKQVAAMVKVGSLTKTSALQADAEKIAATTQLEKSRLDQNLAYLTLQKSLGLLTPPQP